MIATKQDVIAVAPCFASLSEAQWAIHLPLAGSCVADDAWASDAQTRLAQALFVAHHLAIVFPDMAGDEFLVSSERVGAVSRSYAVPVLDPTVLGLTRWGAQFLALRRTVPTFFVP